MELRTFLPGVPLVLARIMCPLKDRRAGTYYNFGMQKQALIMMVATPGTPM
jgi:hypothetical protein